MTHSPISDPARVAATVATGLLDSEAEESFDRLTRLASRLLRAPIAIVNLLDAHRQFSKSVAAPEWWPVSRETQLSDSFCRLVVDSGEAVAINDAQADERVSTSVVVTELGARSYLGTPLTDGDGHTLGALCVLDVETRQWGEEEAELLAELAQSVMTEIELRRDIARRTELESALRAARDELESRVAERTAELEVARTKSEGREAYFRALAENTRDVVAVFEHDGTLRYANPTLAREYADVPPKVSDVNLFAFVHPGDVSALRAAWEGAQPSARPTMTECRLRVRTGEWHLHEVLLENLADDPVVRGMVTHMRDVAELHRHEEELRRGREQLRQAEKMDAVGRLAGGIAHDFNNLLTIVNGYSALALDVVEPSDPLYEDLEKIQLAGKQAADLTRQLMAFSRQQLMALQPVDINNVVTTAQRLLTRLIGEDIRIVTELEPHPWPVKADPGQMSQVLMNLVLNARDAMPGGGTISVSSSNVELSEAYAAQHPEVTAGPHVMLAVGDTGVGMTTETQFRIFEPFFTTKSAGRGTGLGLATVHGIVNQMGGHIWLYSEPGQGTTFKIYLPRLNDDDVFTAAEPRPKVEAAAAARETILLVEDEAGVQELASRLLRTEGYSVIAVGSGAEALALSPSLLREVHLLLTDVVMPDMGGPELVGRMHAVSPGLPVVMMSGYTGDEIDRRGMVATRFPLVNKPFTKESLCSAVRAALDSPPSAMAATEVGAFAVRHSIAIVDDSQDNRDVLSSLLEDDYTVEAYSSGQEALDAFQHHIPHLVILDIAMPGLSGLDVVARIRSDAHLRHLPVIAITARAMLGDREALLAAGFDDYLGKPIVDEQVLLDMIARHLLVSHERAAV